MVTERPAEINHGVGTKTILKMSETMHVRWERQIVNSNGRITQFQLVALLVEGCVAEKNENAKVLTALGAIQERFLRIRISKTKAFHQGLFWVKVDQKFEDIGLGKRRPTNFRVSDF